MSHRILLGVLARSAMLALLPLGLSWAEGVVITEFMAVNGSSIQDQHKEFSDWIEIYNNSQAPVNLKDYALTDDARDLDRWVFPEVILDPGRFLIVFASKLDLRDPAEPLHTNFSLSEAGEFLALIHPDGYAVSAFYPTYPAQVPDVSYGVSIDVSIRTIVDAGATARYLVPQNNDLGITWTAPEFDDASWGTGPTGIGFDVKAQPTYADLIRTDVAAAMQGASTSIYIRIPFTASDPDLLKPWQLRVQYEDGFVAFLNGTEIARRNLSSAVTPRNNSKASKTRSEDEARVFETVPLMKEGLVRSGDNVLAIQALNYTTTDPDLLMVPVLEILELNSIDQDQVGYFAAPTPGLPNAELLSGLAEAPQFSKPGGAYTEALSLELSVAAPGTEIRFTLDGSEPKESSTLYSEPIQVTKTLVVKAKTFKAGFVPSTTVIQSYVLFAPNLAGFESNLPLVVINTFGKAILGTGQCNLTPAHFLMVDRGPEGKAKLTGTPHFMGFGGMRDHGSSTGGQTKRSWNLELWDDRYTINLQAASVPASSAQDKKVSIFGLPADSDFLLFTGFDYDLANIRNPFMYELSRQCGRWAARTRFCEVYLNTSQGAVSQSHYWGIYAFMEKVKRGVDRVDVEEIFPEYEEEPEVMGGYVLKIDRADPCGMSVSGGGQSLNVVYPKEQDLRQSPRQSAWITAFMNQMSASLGGPDYEQYIDADSWIDHHILNVLSKNVDAFRLSGYMFKRRLDVVGGQTVDGRLQMGPIWDFDRSINSTDGRDDSPTTWDGTGDATRFFEYPWWNVLFKRADFYGRYVKRWKDLRKGPLRTENLHAVIDAMGAEIREAQARDYQKWRRASPAQWEADLKNMKNWLSTRATWIDGQLIVPPEFSPPAGDDLVTVGLEVSIIASEGDILYTINGPDPMLASGAVAPEAVAYTGPIAILENARIRARVKVGARAWSTLSQAIYLTRLVPFLVTEIHFAPAEDPSGTYRASDFEFLELRNTGAAPLDLKAIQMVRPRFIFSSGSVMEIEPEGYVLLVNNTEAFRSRYGDQPRIAGEFSGSLSDTRADIEMLGPVGETVLKFAYEAAWYPAAKAEGRSLVLRDATIPRGDFGKPESWWPSLEVGGSPGRDDVAPGDGRQLPGDINQDRRITVSDGVAELLYLIGAYASPCAEGDGTGKLLDTNGDGKVDVADAIYTLNYLFRRGPAPAMGAACVAIAGCPSVCE